MPNQDFIESVLNAAVQIQKDYNLSAPAITAQACLETGYGKNVITDVNTGQYSYNLFNIKGQGPAGSVLVDTIEYYNGVRKEIRDHFRAYNNFQESFEDLVKLMSNDRYAPCRNAAGDPCEYARQLQECGYATDPQYAAKLIKIMQMYDLIKQANDKLQRL